MWKTILALLITILVIPFLAFAFDEPLVPFQQEILKELIMVYLAAALLCFVVSTLTGNYSQVDKLWSLMPLAYVWMVAVNSGFEPRLVLMAIVVTVWGLRLSYNFSRRGGYSIRFWTGEEDYRTPIAESEQFYAALKLEKVETAMVRIPGASHGIANKPSNLIAKIASVLAWFEKYKKD